MTEIQLAFPLQEKYKICEAEVDTSKDCTNCKHLIKPETDYPCNECFNALLGLPPTKWENP